MKLKSFLGEELCRSLPEDQAGARRMELTALEA